MRTAVVLLAILAAVVASLPSAAAQNEDLVRIVVVPDTQIYAQSDSGATIAQSQFDWIADNAPATNTVFVTHVGDVVQDPNSATEWDRIEPGFDALETAGVPYGIAPGNHDISSDRLDAIIDSRFSVDRFDGQSWFGGSHSAEGNRSSWQTAKAGHHDLLFLHLRHLVDDYGSVEAVLAWAQAVLDAHPDHLAIVTTHEFTNGDGSVALPAVRNALAPSCNVALVLSGHRTGEAAHGTFDDACGRTVHHLLTNYQFITGGGQGFLRTLDLNPITLGVESSVYSPTLDEFRTGGAESFSFELAPLVVVRGDANCDRTVDLNDAIMVVQHVVGGRSSTASCIPYAPEQVARSGADVDGTGLDLDDAIWIVRCSVGVCE